MLIEMVLMDTHTFCFESHRKKKLFYPYKHFFFYVNWVFSGVNDPDIGDERVFGRLFAGHHRTANGVFAVLGRVSSS